MAFSFFLEFITSRMMNRSKDGCALHLPVAIAVEQVL